jgi:hypothetical protein
LQFARLDWATSALLDEPGRQRAQLFGVVKLELAFNFDVRHNYGQHLVMNIGSRDPIRHSVLLAGTENVQRLP